MVAESESDVTQYKALGLGTRSYPQRQLEGPRGPWEPLGAPRRLPRPLGPPAVVVDSFWFPTGRSFEVGPDIKLRVGGLFLGTAYHMALCARA